MTDRLGMVTNDLTVGRPLVWWANRLHPRIKVVEQRGAASFPGRRGIKVHLIKAEYLVKRVKSAMSYLHYRFVLRLFFSSDTKNGSEEVMF